MTPSFATGSYRGEEGRSDTLKLVNKISQLHLSYRVVCKGIKNNQDNCSSGAPSAEKEMPGGSVLQPPPSNQPGMSSTQAQTF